MRRDARCVGAATPGASVTVSGLVDHAVRARVEREDLAHVDALRVDGDRALPRLAVCRRRIVDRTVRISGARTLTDASDAHIRRDALGATGSAARSADRIVSADTTRSAAASCAGRTGRCDAGRSGGRCAGLNGVAASGERHEQNRGSHCPHPGAPSHAPMGHALRSGAQVGGAPPPPAMTSPPVSHAANARTAVAKTNASGYAFMGLSVSSGWFRAPRHPGWCRGAFRLISNRRTRCNIDVRTESP